MVRSLSTRRSASQRRLPNFRPDAEGLERRQLLNAGDLDTSFGTGGYALPGPVSAQAVQIQPTSGDVLAAGEVYPTSTSGDFRVVALTPSGGLDPAFVSGGSVTTDFAGKEDRPEDMAVMSDGRIVVAGWADTGTGKVKGLTVTNFDFAVARYLPSGALDTTFGNGTGKVTTNISTYSSTDTFNHRDEAWTVTIQDDGKIVVGGRAYTGPGTTEGVLVRYNADGTLDTTFGGTGIVTINLPNFTSDGVWDVAFLRDPTNAANDKLVTMEAPVTTVSGNTHWSVAVARYNLDGTLDTTYGTSGRTITTMPGQIDAWGMVLQADGSAVVGGGYTPQSGAPSDLALFRYTPAGAPDSTFGNNGVTLFNAGGSDLAYAVAIEPSDGKILLAGSMSTSPGSALVARFQTNGVIDTTFGTGGVAVNAFTNAGSSFRELTVQSDGKIVAAGGASTTSGKTTTSSFLIARFLGDPVTATAAATASTSAALTPENAALVPLVQTGDQDLTALVTDLIPISAGKTRRAVEML